MKYLVLELQTMTDGQVANLVYSYDDYREAQSKYFDVLHYAATSELPSYAAMLFNSEGFLLENRCFHRGISTQE